MGRRPLKILSRNELRQLTDKRLLAYRSRFYKVPEGPSYEETLYGGRDRALHKKCPAWKRGLVDLKEELSARGHIDRVNS